MMEWMYALYTTDPGQRKEIYASPLHATVEQLKGLPPALIQVAEKRHPVRRRRGIRSQTGCGSVTITTVC